MTFKSSLNFITEMLKNFKHDWSYPLAIKFLVADTHWEETKNCVDVLTKEVATSKSYHEDSFVIGNNNCIIDFFKYDLTKEHLYCKGPRGLARCSFMFIDSDIATLPKFKEDLEEIYMPLCNYKWNFVETIKFCEENNMPAQIEFINI